MVWEVCLGKTVQPGMERNSNLPPALDPEWALAPSWGGGKMLNVLLAAGMERRSRSRGKQRFRGTPGAWPEPRTLCLESALEEHS